MEVQEYLVATHDHGHNSENSLAFQYLAVDPLQVLTRPRSWSIRPNAQGKRRRHDVHTDLGIVDGLLSVSALDST